MDFVKNQIQRIQQQLAGLTASQRMLTLALVAVMVMTLLYWARYAGTADMEPLLDQAFTQQDIGRVQAFLQSKGVKYENASERILVPAERKMELLADLAFARMLPQNTETGFDKMAAKMSPFAPPSEREQLYNRGKEITCGQMIERWPGVEQATVMIDPTSKRQIGGNVEPSATINITMSTASATGARQVAEAAAMTVAGAQAGLKVPRITVTINGVPQRLRDPNSADAITGGQEEFEARQRYATMHQDNIRELFDYIVGLRVVVSVDIDTDRVVIEDEKHGRTQVVPTEEETQENSAGGGDAQQDTGVVPNLRSNEEMVLTGSNGAGGQSSREERTHNRNVAITDRTRTHTTKTPGQPTIVSASVRVPRSYFVASLKQLNPDAPTPDGKAIEAYAAQELERIADGVRGATGMADDRNVAVTTFVDVLPALATANGAALPPTATMSVPVMLGSYGKEIALGGLAVVALFMLMMMVRKSTPAPAVVAAAIPAGPPPQLVAGEMLAGEAGTGDPMLSGMELDEDAVQTQQMLDQVSTMVNDNPDAAASLVKRWLNRD